MKSSRRMETPFTRSSRLRQRSAKRCTLTIRRRGDAPAEGVVVVPEPIIPNKAFLKAMEESARIIDANGVKIGYIHVWSYAGAAVSATA